jgi:hypothetical protein
MTPEPAKQIAAIAPERAKPAPQSAPKPAARPTNYDQSTTDSMDDDPSF